jgi:protease IV
MAQNKDKIIVLTIIGAAIILFVVFAIITIATTHINSDLPLASMGGKIALIEVTGVIEESASVIRQLKDYQDDGSIKALVLRVDSPGGQVAPSQEIYDQLLRFKEKGKPIIVSMGSVAASGGYYISCAADTIVSNPGTLTGSIGVIFSFPNLQSLMDKVGIKMEVIKSGELKDVGSPTREMTPKERQMLQSVIDDTYNQFVDVVATSRHLEVDSVKALADGSVFTGRQAKRNGLVDKLGTLEDAIAVAGNMADLGDHPRVVKERKLNRSILLDLLNNILGIDVTRSSLIRPWPSLEYRFNY